MPPINYSKSIIYRICCKDASISDEYVGSTTDKKSRKANHKISCNNQYNKNYNLPVYQFIRENGGFDNFDFIILEEYPCENKIQLKQKERYWIELRKPTLNRNIPMRTQKEYDELHKEDITERKKKYYQDNRKYIIERNCKNQKEKIICECGAEICKSSLSHHRKSEYHKFNSPIII